MKIAYFDCFAGISGDMTLGALVDAGLPFDQLQADIAKLKLTGYCLEMERVKKQGISGTKVNVITEETNVHRHLNDISQIIFDSDLPDAVQTQSLAVFNCLAEAEAKIHGTSPDKVHFHEVGAIDSIIDIVGSVAGLWRLEVEEVFASPVHTGSGFVQCAHGNMPVPAPAVLELLRDIPVYSGNIQSELVTPTGAALLRTYCKHFGGIPLMQIKTTGYGAGQRNLDIPNLLRLSIGEKVEHHATDAIVRYGGRGEVHQAGAMMMEVNIDDMNPEFYDYLFEKLLQAGAMDVFLHKIQMKKNRPGVILSVLIEQEQAEKFYQLLFAETTSIGVRTYPVSKYMLPYEIITVSTKLGIAKVKVARLGNQLCNVAPEYEDCRNLAKAHSLPIKEVYDTVKFAAYTLLQS